MGLLEQNGWIVWIIIGGLAGGNCQNADAGKIQPLHRTIRSHCQALLAAHRQSLGL